MKTLLTILLIWVSSLAINAQTDSLKPLVTTLEIKGTTYTVCKKFPEEICGEYLFNKKSGPRVLLNADGTGYFERHGVKPHEIKFWIVCDAEGNVKKNYSLDLNYFVTILYQYTDTDVRALWGEYETLDIRIAYDEGYAIIHQERYHLFKKR